MNSISHHQSVELATFFMELVLWEVPAEELSIKIHFTVFI